MADDARLTIGIAPRILASWRHPSKVVRELAPMREGAMLALLMGAMAIFLIAQMPGHARAAALDPGIPFNARMAGATMAVLFVMPLLAYALAFLAGLAILLIGWHIAAADSRLALFWALLAISPVMLLSGLVEGVTGPGAALYVVRLIAGLGFLLIWGAGLRALVVQS